MGIFKAISKSVKEVGKSITRSTRPNYTKRKEEAKAQEERARILNIQQSLINEVTNQKNTVISKINEELSNNLALLDQELKETTENSTLEYEKYLKELDDLLNKLESNHQDKTKYIESQFTLYKEKISNSYKEQLDTLISEFKNKIEQKGDIERDLIKFLKDLKNPYCSKHSKTRAANSIVEYIDFLSSLDTKTESHVKIKNYISALLKTPLTKSNIIDKEFLQIIKSKKEANEKYFHKKLTGKLEFNKTNLNNRIKTLLDELEEQKSKLLGDENDRYSKSRLELDSNKQAHINEFSEYLSKLNSEVETEKNKVECKRKESLDEIEVECQKQINQINQHVSSNLQQIDELLQKNLKELKKQRRIGIFNLISAPLGIIGGLAFAVLQMPQMSAACFSVSLSSIKNLSEGNKKAGVGFSFTPPTDGSNEKFKKYEKQIEDFQKKAKKKIDFNINSLTPVSQTSPEIKVELNRILPNGLRSITWNISDSTGGVFSNSGLFQDSELKKLFPSEIDDQYWHRKHTVVFSENNQYSRGLYNAIMKAQANGSKKDKKFYAEIALQEPPKPEKKEDSYLSARMLQPYKNFVHFGCSSTSDLTYKGYLWLLELTGHRKAGTLSQYSEEKDKEWQEFILTDEGQEYLRHIKQVKNELITGGIIALNFYPPTALASKIPAGLAAVGRVRNLMTFTRASAATTSVATASRAYTLAPSILFSRMQNSFATKCLANPTINRLNYFSGISSAILSPESTCLLAAAGIVFVTNTYNFSSDKTLSQFNLLEPDLIPHTNRGFPIPPPSEMTIFIYPETKSGKTTFIFVPVDDWLTKPLTEEQDILNNPPSIKDSIFVFTSIEIDKKSFIYLKAGDEHWLAHVDYFKTDFTFNGVDKDKTFGIILPPNKYSSETLRRKYILHEFQSITSANIIALDDVINLYKLHQAHHVIPQELKDHLVLLKANFNLDCKDNCIMLPKKDGVDDKIISVHNGSHKAYNIAARILLNNIPTSKLSDKVELRKEIINIICVLKRIIKRHIPIRKKDYFTKAEIDYMKKNNISADEKMANEIVKMFNKLN